jgi:hypothetical protein
MDLSAFKGRMTEAKQAKMMKLGQCFWCGAHGHLLRNCPEKGKGKESIRINKLEEELRRLKLDGGNQAETPKNGVAWD